MKNLEKIMKIIANIGKFDYITEYKKLIEK